jgi:hypothetical protein
MMPMIAPAVRCSGEVHLSDLAGKLRYDFSIVVENANTAEDFAAIRSRVILRNGDKTRPYLKQAVEALAATIPHASRVVLPGLNHSAIQNEDQWGAPKVVAAAVAEFLSSRGPSPG